MRISDWSSDVCSSDLSSPASKPQPPPAPMKVLGIESHCDETGVAVYDTALAGGAGLRAHAVYSQIALHPQYGGGVPALDSHHPQQAEGGMGKGVLVRVTLQWRRNI